VGLARLDQKVDFATRLGQDERGARVANHLTRHGVSLTAASTAAPSTSVAEAHLDATGAAEYTFDLHWDLPRVRIPAGATHVHTGSIAAVLEPGATSVLETLRSARERATISYDPNLRPDIMGDLDHVRERVEEISPSPTSSRPVTRTSPSSTRARPCRRCSADGPSSGRPWSSSPAARRASSSA
jgi:fructokinase